VELEVGSAVIDQRVVIVWFLRPMRGNQMRSRARVFDASRYL
jgi:hypothetical protein